MLVNGLDNDFVFFGLKEKVCCFLEKFGVYLMKDWFGCIFYVGKVKSLKKCVLLYFMLLCVMMLYLKICVFIELIEDFDVIEVKFEFEVLLFEGWLIK